MKLYATVTSERASKGQGGNKFLDIQVKDDNGEVIFSAYIVPKIDDVGDFTDIKVAWAEHVYINGQHGLDAEIITKGEKQKGESVDHEPCEVCNKRDCTRYRHGY